MQRSILILILLVVCSMTLTGFVLRREASMARRDSNSALAVMLGDGRKLFANHFLSKADAYFHRGRYPSVFELAERQSENHLVTSLGKSEADMGSHEDEMDQHSGASEEHDPNDAEVHAHDESCEHAELAAGPDDWLSRLAARFEPDEHVHLEGGKEKEMLPWIKLAVELDPQDVNAYAVGGYWLRVLGSPEEAEAFLREGQRKNPDSYEIYFELGRLNELEGRDPQRIARLYGIAVGKWQLANQGVEEPDDLGLAQILGRLGHVLEESGDLQGALRTYTWLKQVSPNPDAIQRLIDSTQAHLSEGSPSAVH